MNSKKLETLNTQDVLSMKGEGYYSKKTAGAKNAIDSIQEILEKAVISPPNKEILRFADFGAADGGTSQELWYNCLLYTSPSPRDLYRSRMPSSA